VATKKQPVRRKHVPQRTCVVCRRTLDKRVLVRIVGHPEGGVSVDPTGKQNGRGAYLCTAAACWERALSTEVLAHALRTTLTEADYARLRDSRPEPIE